MAAGDSFPALALFTLIEAYLLQRTVFADESFRTVILGAFGVNILLKGIYSLIIWPYFLSPLRHLPTAPVSPFLSDKYHPDHVSGVHEPCQSHL